jgi:hypothetical protein
MRLQPWLAAAIAASVLGSSLALAAGAPGPDKRTGHTEECDTLFRSIVTYSGPPRPGSFGENVLAVVAADFNGDRVVDLADANNWSSVTVRFGRGDGTFEPGVNYPVRGGPAAIVTADFNGDAIADLATADRGSDSVSVFLGQGTSGHPRGTFAAPVNSASSHSPEFMATGDFNHDGIVDLAVNYNYFPSGVSILIGRGDGSFAPPVDYPLEWFSAGVATGDFDGDGILDLAVAVHGRDRVAILRGQGSGGAGNGAFIAPDYYPTGEHPTGISVGDLDSDGILDLALALDSFVPSGLTVLFGHGSGRKGDGTFGSPVSYPTTSSTAVAAGDFDGDRIPDLAVAGARPGGIALLHGIRGAGHDGRFQPLGWAPLPVGPLRAIAAADFDGDGLLDLAVGNYFGGLSVLLTRDRSGRPVHHPPGWVPDGLALCTALGDQVAPVAIPDGARGAFVAWTDGRMGVGTVYVQHVKGNGVPLWATDGVPVCVEQGPGRSAALAVDGQGGAWIGVAGKGVHIQHITPAGAFDLSPCPGIEVSSDDAFGITLAADGAGGVYASYIALYQSSYETSYTLYCQHLTASGTSAPGWPAEEGVPISGANDGDSVIRSRMKRAQVWADGAGGAMVSWDIVWFEDQGDDDGAYSSFARIGGTGAVAYRVQRVGEEAEVVTAADGSQLLVSRERTVPQSDDSSRVVAKRVGSDGAVGWTTSLCSGPGVRRLAGVAPFTDGGAAAVWIDNRSGSSDLYAGRVTRDGQLASGWPTDGAPVCLASGDQVQPAALALADGRLLTCWLDGRGTSNDIYGALLRADGTRDPGWPADGTPICTASDAQTSPVMVQSDADAAIVVWQDHRCGNWDIYAQEIQLAIPVAKRDAASGGDTARGFSLRGTWPNPARARFTVAFTLPDAGSVKLEVLDVAGRKVLVRELRGMGAGPHVVNLGEEEALPPGVYAVRVHAGGQVLSRMVVLTR